MTSYCRTCGGLQNIADSYLNVEITKQESLQHVANSYFDIERNNIHIICCKVSLFLTRADRAAAGRPAGPAAPANAEEQTIIIIIIILIRLLLLLLLLIMIIVILMILLLLLLIIITDRVPNIKRLHLAPRNNLN